MSVRFSVRQTIGAQARKVEQRVLKKALRQAAADGGKVLLDRMKTLVPVKQGLLKKSLGRKASIYASRGVAWCGAGPRTKMRWVLSRTRSKRGKVRVKATKKPFVFGEKKDKDARWPSKVAHLAGPGRRARFVKQTLRSSRGAVRAAFARRLREAIQRR